MATPNSRRNRDARSDDLYTTPLWAIFALLRHENFVGNICDAGAGLGAMTIALEQCGYTDITPIDLHAHGFQHANLITGVNYLEHIIKYDNVISNPPYKILAEFIRHAIDHSNFKVALFTRLDAITSVKRFELIYKSTPPARAYVFARRVTCNKGGDESIPAANSVNYAWYVFDKSHRGPTETIIIDDSANTDYSEMIANHTANHAAKYKKGAAITASKKRAKTEAKIRSFLDENPEALISEAALALKMNRSHLSKAYGYLFTQQETL